MALLVWVPSSSFLEQTARHTIANRPKYSRRACERLSWYLGPKGNLSCTRVRGPPVALHVSQQISLESWGFAGVAAVSRYTPLKGPVAPVTLDLPGVSHVKLPLKRCRATGGVAATLAGVALHCATKKGMLAFETTKMPWGRDQLLESTGF